jgi:hypothetical protein
MKELGWSRRWKLTCVVLLLALPAVVFYFILCRTAVNLPILDDYQIILGTTNSLSQAHTLTSQAAIVLNSEHNGYKLMFENGVVGALYDITGHIYILPLVVFGNAFALVIFSVVALMAKDAATDVLTWLIRLVPAAYFLFQLQYASALNFASSSLQHLAVVAFSLLAIYFLSRHARSTFVLSCIASVLAIASSPNGFFLAPVGVLMIIQQKRWKWLACWITLFLIMLGLYLFHYTSMPAPEGSHEAAATSLHHINVIYALSFVGSSVARYSSVLPSVLLGILLCAFAGFATVRRYFLQNPAVFYSMLFILINAIAVSSLRSDSGVAQSLASRYRTYSNLMLVFSYLFIAETILPKWKSSVARRTAFAAITVASVMFCLVSDAAGARFLNEKKLALTQSYRMQWQKNLTAGTVADAEIQANPALRRQIEAGVYNVNRPVLQESVRLGLYDPPLEP